MLLLLSDWNQRCTFHHVVNADSNWARLDGVHVTHEAGEVSAPALMLLAAAALPETAAAAAAPRIS